jgi:DNA-binding HxlR family transcriptional regulator
VRDMMFKGLKSYNDFLNAGEGIATNILSDRLQKLEWAGIISKLSDPNDARRFIYCLTARGINLAPMLVEMILWSARNEQTDAPPKVIKAMTTDRDGFVAKLREKWQATKEL